MTKTKTTPAKKTATKKAPKAFKLTSKNIMADAAKKLSLNEIVFQLAPKHTNLELVEMLDKMGKAYKLSSLYWYASKARAGVRR